MQKSFKVKITIPRKYLLLDTDPEDTSPTVDLLGSEAVLGQGMKITEAAVQSNEGRNKLASTLKNRIAKNGNRPKELKGSSPKNGS